MLSPGLSLGMAGGPPGQGGLVVSEPLSHGLRRALTVAKVAVLAGLLRVPLQFWRGALACCSGGPTGRGVMRDGRVSWGGVEGPHPSAADVAGAGMRAVSKERAHMYSGTRGDACLPTRGKTCLGKEKFKMALSLKERKNFKWHFP